ncbi:MAG: DNA protecting protein DprA [Armatimonadetes bacterium CG2_30_66_41]|nr:DNA-protecting protein DprA [Armatimonadota bacterium]OIP03178.1 MAG: DNA protecting protein DprA [Armatimonadetes bacterium CG2_30_66_41]NCO95043.1 DNA-protecting protein DprA [Armatimonadota bacterium]NCP30429.1 DNA-protecting protein DprA [Armatimonadota bacterium]NCQ31112.1 DNA-protecting protein DprA [Armatimonadota bacterium]
MESWLKLSHSQLSPRKQHRLLEVFGDPAAVLSATTEALSQIGGLTEADVAHLRSVNRTFAVASVQEKLRAAGAVATTLRDATYPRPLRNIADPPVVLYVRGQWHDSDERSVALVGTRRPTNYGRVIAEDIGAALAQRGIVVVSGMAAGVDTAAHRGALGASGRTIAVFGCGIDVIYPRENRSLARDIAASGALLSEYSCGVKPDPWRFPARNRLLSGLTMGTVVIEAPENSGALITADFAAEQGREVFAVPGSIKTGKSKGCHALIQDGAKLVDGVEDILSELRLDSVPVVTDRPAPLPADLSPAEQCVVRVLPFSEMHVDEVIRAAGLSAADTNASLMLLEIKGIVRRLPGGMFLRTR